MIVFFRERKNPLVIQRKLRERMFGWNGVNSAGCL